MRIVELGDCSMVIMKDSEDPLWVSIGDLYRKAIKYKSGIAVERLLGSDTDINAFRQISNDYIYTAGRLILFFSSSIGTEYQLHDRVHLRFITNRLKN